MLRDSFDKLQHLVRIDFYPSFAQPMLQPRMITLHWSAMCIFTACTSPILEALLLGLGKFQGHFPLASTQPQKRRRARPRRGLRRLSGFFCILQPDAQGNGYLTANLQEFSMA